MQDPLLYSTENASLSPSQESRYHAKRLSGLFQNWSNNNGADLSPSEFAKSPNKVLSPDYLSGVVLPTNPILLDDKVKLVQRSDADSTHQSTPRGATPPRESLWGRYRPAGPFGDPESPDHSFELTNITPPARASSDLKQNILSSNNNNAPLQYTSSPSPPGNNEGFNLSSKREVSIMHHVVYSICKLQPQDDIDNPSPNYVVHANTLCSKSLYFSTVAQTLGSQAENVITSSPEHALSFLKRFSLDPPIPFVTKMQFITRVFFVIMLAFILWYVACFKYILFADKYLVIYNESQYILDRDHRHMTEFVISNAVPSWVAPLFLTTQSRSLDSPVLGNSMFSQYMAPSIPVSLTETFEDAPSTALSRTSRFYTTDENKQEYKQKQKQLNQRNTRIERDEVMRQEYAAVHSRSYRVFKILHSDSPLSRSAHLAPQEHLFVILNTEDEAAAASSPDLITSATHANHGHTYSVLPISERDAEYLVLFCSQASNYANDKCGRYNDLDAQQISQIEHEASITTTRVSQEENQKDRLLIAKTLGIN